MVIMWTTDEPSRSIVRYSTNLSFSLSATNNELTTSHSVSIVNFKGGATYNFIVISSDEAGNTATNNNGGAFTFVGVPPATALLVDAYVPDADSTVIPVSTYTDALTAAGISFNVWNVTQHTNSSAPLSTLKAFPVVIWRVSDSLYTDSPNSTLSSSDQNNLTTYVNSGGSFFMSSMETLSRIGDVPFRKNILQVASFTTNPDPFSVCTDCDEDVGVPSIQGTGNDPVSSGVNTILDYSNYPELDLLGTIIGPDLSDTFTPTTNAVTILRDPSSGKNVGIRFPRTGSDSPGRVVFCAFPFDTIPAAGASPNNRANIMRNIISFLAPGANGLGTITLDNATYTVPGLVTVEVGDSDLAGLGQATANFTSTTQTNPVTITLKETVRPGLFRGFVSLIPTNATAGPGQLRAKNGDAIVARYFDASANGTVQVAATVDTIPVTISVVSVEPGYQDAVVSWTTSDPADSLVQYGESVLLGRTAYAGDFDIDHEVTLQGLLTDHDYYFKVVSHDEAGNTTVDDNQGQLYTFHTLLPKRPPFMDDMEHGPTNWTVIDADGTEVSWTLGKPDNGLETNGHSPTNAWGSNLHGESTGSVESYLVSPAIELVGGNNAVLQFWHSYDFTPLSDSDLLEYGEVLVLTNTTSDPVVLATFDQFSDGYEPVTLDLTPYLGKVVYLAWHYLEFSLQNAPRPGWLVDDVSVTVSNAPVGTVVVTNNLAAGLFAISGPMNRNGSGMQTTISNAPPGQYVIQFGGVAYYQTPANQTNTLTAGTTLTFTGNYTFVDANHNGIPDSWETQYFGTVSSNRTAFTDTDGDGMTDRAEFIAGTDPTNAASKLSFIMPFNQVSNVIQMQWSAVPGRLYRLESSTNMTSWTPMSGWLPGSSSSMSYTVTNQPPDRARLFRVRVQN
jgi:hypothetical protein